MKMSMMQRLIVAAALAATPAFAAADGEKVQASGEGVAKDKGAACDNAKKAAMRNAVESSAGVYLAADSLAKDSMLVHDKILTRADGFVSGVKVLEEKASAVTGSPGDMQCAVKIEAVVEKSKLGDEAKKIAAAFAARGRPKVLLMIAEQAVGMNGPVGWWQKDGEKAAGVSTIRMADIRHIETVMMERMMKDGWKFIDPETLKGKISIAGAVSANPSDKELREFGKLAAAEVVIWGTSRSDEPTDAGLGAGMLSATAEMTARAVATDTGEIFALYKGRKTKPGFSGQLATSNAMGDLAKAAAEELQRKIVDEWVSQAYGTQRVVLNIKGLKDYGALSKFKAALSSGVSAVKEVNQCKFEGSAATCDIEVDGGADKLADALSLAAFQEYAINVDKVTGGSLDVTLSGGAGKKK